MDKRSPNYERGLYINTFGDYQPLWRPTDPSSQLRSRICSPSDVSTVCRQNILLNDPSTVLYLTGNEFKPNGSRIEVTETGERFNFTASVTETSDMSVYSHLNEDHVHNKILDPSENTEIGKSKKEKQIERRLINEKIKPLIDSITAKLKKLPPRKYSCDRCANDKSRLLIHLDKHVCEAADETCEPCPHSLSLSCVPTAYDISIFEEAGFTNKPLNEVAKLMSNNDNTVNIDPPNYLPRIKLTERSHPKKVKQISDDEFSLSDVEVDHLLTYTPNMNDYKHGCMKTKSECDIKKLMDNSLVTTNAFDSLDTAGLRNVAAKINSTKHSQLLPTFIGSNINIAEEQLGTYVGHSHQSSIVTLMGPNVSDKGKKLENWIFPEEFNVQNKKKFGDSSVAPSFRPKYHNKDDDSGLKIVPPRSSDGDYVIDQSNNMEDRILVAQESDEDFVYNNEMNIDLLMSKFIRLRKMENCPPESLKALKHLICGMMNKEKLYLRHRKQNDKFRENDPKSEHDDIVGDKLQRIIGNINRFESLESQDGIYPQAFSSDDESIYTYSSLSVSSYDSIFKNVTLKIDDNKVLQESANSLHKTVLDIYGWLNVINENSLNRGSNAKMILYCELIGDRFYFYSAKDKKNFKHSIDLAEPVITINLDDYFTVVTRYDKKRGQTSLRINGKGSACGYNGAMMPQDAERSKGEDTYFFQLEADSEVELINWSIALNARSRMKSFMSMLDKHKIHPFNNTPQFLLYPRKRELYFSKLEYDNAVDDIVANRFIKSSLYRLDFSRRGMTDDDLRHHMNLWRVSINIIDLSQNNLQISEIHGEFPNYLRNRGIIRVYLDENPLSEKFFRYCLVNIALMTDVIYMSFRGSFLHDSIIESIMSINRKSKKGGIFTLDMRECTFSSEVDKFLKSRHFNNMRIILSNSQTNLPEYQMAYFVDCKNLREISDLGASLSGRLFTHLKTRRRNSFSCFARSVDKDLTSDVYFEYRSPYLIWYDWPQKNRKSLFSGTKTKSAIENPRELSESQILYIKFCEVVIRDGKRWLHLKGCTPKKCSARHSPTKSIFLMGYTDFVTRRWFEIISRTLAGVCYTEYLQKNPLVDVSRHILNFCIVNDADTLIMNEFPIDKALVPKFLGLLKFQSSLKVLSFTNMQLNNLNLAFERSITTGLDLDVMDWSFNTIELGNASDKVFNSLAPKISCKNYTISNNPLGDNTKTVSLFLMCCFDLRCSKISLNYCELGDFFLEKLIGELTREDRVREYGHLEILELEGNNFSLEKIQEFVEIIDVKFPNLVSVRLHGCTWDPEAANSLLRENQVCSLDNYAITEPSVGSFTRKIHIKKAKKTTREIVSRLLQSNTK